jgi:hypothetical protein
MVSSASSASWNVVGRPWTSKAKRLIERGVGVKTRGYCFGSLSMRSLGGFIISGGRDTVVVVVVVTTVCWVAGPKVMEATVEFGGGMVFMVLLGGLSIVRVVGG